MKPALFAVAALVGLSACATAPDKIVARSVSPSLYGHMTCREMNTEAQRVNGRLAAVTGAQQSRASRDTTMTAVSLLLFWPAALAIGHGQDHEGEIAQLRGEAEALSASAAAKGC